MKTDLFNFGIRMNEDEEILSYVGNLTSDILTSVLQLAENKLDKLDETTKIKKRVYNILIEALQNLYHHIVENPKIKQNSDVSTIHFRFGKVDGEFKILTGNCIENAKVKQLKSKLDKINSLDGDALKKYYQEVLNNGLISDKGGGGLGMIDIARKSGKNLEYNFKEIDNNYSFYSLLIKVGE